MLIEFTVGNFLSFKEKKTMSLEAAAIKDNMENVVVVGKYKLLRTAVIYGANSSGKSNFIKALDRMRDILMTSASYNSTSDIDVVPFLLSTETVDQPSYFEILILIDGVRYRYGFEATNKKIYSEWLFERKAASEKALFYRENDAIEVAKAFVEGKGLEVKTRDNALFLSIVDQFNGTISKKIMEWFYLQRNLSGIQHEMVNPLTFAFLDSEVLNGLIKDFLTPLSLGFQDFEVKDDKIVTYHNSFDEKGTVRSKRAFDLLKQESAGTNKIYDLAGSIVYALKKGALIVIDELDAKLHPLLTMAIVQLFNSPIHNTQNAQLIFATHDTNLLSYGCFRRDQIYFTEKNSVESTDLYSLVEYIEPNGSKIRNDRSFEKDYIAGRYGAIPFIGDFSTLINHG